MFNLLAFSGCAAFLPRPKDMHVGLTGDFNLAIGVRVYEYEQRFVCQKVFFAKEVPNFVEYLK